jgi:hypothetical protein
MEYCTAHFPLFFICDHYYYVLAEGKSFECLMHKKKTKYMLVARIENKIKERKFEGLARSNCEVKRGLLCEQSRR